jgi:hypothetical protein
MDPVPGWKLHGAAEGSSGPFTGPEVMPPTGSSLILHLSPWATGFCSRSLGFSDGAMVCATQHKKHGAGATTAKEASASRENLVGFRLCCMDSSELLLISACLSPFTGVHKVLREVRKGASLSSAGVKCHLCFNTTSWAAGSAHVCRFGRGFQYHLCFGGRPTRFGMRMDGHGKSPSNREVRQLEWTRVEARGVCTGQEYREAHRPRGLERLPSPRMRRLKVYPDGINKTFHQYRCEVERPLGGRVNPLTYDA